jgi:hypothetical protein
MGPAVFQILIAPADFISIPPIGDNVRRESGAY